MPFPLPLTHTLLHTFDPSTRKAYTRRTRYSGLERAYNTRHPGHTDSHSNGSISGPTLNWSRNLTTRLRRIVTPSAYHIADRTKPNLSNSVAKLGCFSLAPTPSTPSPPKNSSSSPGGIDDRGRLDTVRTPVVRISLDTSGPVLAHFHRSISDREVRRNSILGGGSLEQKRAHAAHSRTASESDLSAYLLLFTKRLVCAHDNNPEEALAGLSHLALLDQL